MAGIGYTTLSVIPSMKGFGTAVQRGGTSQMGGAGAALGKTLGLGIVAAATAAVAVGVKGIFAFSEFESSMNEVFTLLPGITKTAMESMSDDTRAFALEMKTTTDQVVPALYQAISAGVPQDNVFDFLEVAQKAAVGGASDLTTAVDGVSGVVNSYGEEVVSAARASDLMFTAVRLGKTTFGELSGSLYNVLPTASALGVGFEDVTASMAAMTAQNIPTNVATTQMRQLLVELSKAGGDAAKTFEKASGKTFKDFIASGGNVNDALVIMGKAAEDNDVNINDLFGSVEAGSAALALFDNSAFTNALTEMDDSAGATDAAYAQMDQGLSRTWESVKSQFSDAALEIGTRLAPSVQTVSTWFSERMPGALDATFAALTTVSDWVTGTGVPALQSFVTWLDENQTTIVVVAGVIATLLTPVLVNMAVQAVRSWALTTAASISGAATQLASHYKVVFGWVLSAGAAITSGAETVAIWALYKIEAAKGAAATLVAHAQMAASWVASTAKTVAALAAQVAAQIGARAVMIASAAAIGIVTAAQWLWNAAMTANPIGIVIVAIGALVAAVVWIATKTTWFQTAWNFVWDKIGGPVKAVWSWIKNNWPLLLAILTGPIGLAVLAIAKNKDKILGFFKEMPGKIGGFFSGIGDFITRPFKNAFNWIARAWNKTVGSLSFSIPDIPGFPGRGTTFSFPKLPELYTGGTVTQGGLAMVGERGAEVVSLPTGSSVYPNGSMPAQGAAVTRADLIAFAREIVDAFRADGDQRTAGAFTTTSLATQLAGRMG